MKIVKKAAPKKSPRYTKKIVWVKTTSKELAPTAVVTQTTEIGEAKIEFVTVDWGNGKGPTKDGNLHWGIWQGKKFMRNFQNCDSFAAAKGIVERNQGRHCERQDDRRTQQDFLGVK